VIEPGKYDITIYQGATFKLALQYKDSTGTPVNMSGYTVAAKLFDRFGTNQLATFTNTWQAQSSGQFTLSLAPVVTSGITENGQYDVLVTEPSGDKYYILQGNAFVDLGLSGR
jgi:hypothetical protein